MIVLIGTNSKIIKNGNISNVNCPNCKINSTLHYSVYSRYTHLTLIPLFPVGKEAVVTCESCNNIIEINSLDDKTISKLYVENNNLKNPIWMFFGSFIIILAIIYGIFNYYKNNNETEIYIKKPMVNDVYAIKDSKGYYYTLRIDAISNDSIFATENDFQVDLPYDIDEINKTKNYTKNKIIYSKFELLKFYKDDKIISIIRN
ncbi:zinc-ribbon domain-containing protein [Flavobacterium sp.]|uniref:zinc-ribbon domain-containing protein n=1 Tax=Flavobacterium sp. TaxID=239 RepID=UPI0037509F64